MAGGGAALSRVSSRGRLAAPYPTVPYSTVPYCVLPDSRNIRQSISYPVSLKESQGERKPLWETGENVENYVESVWRTCFKALRPLRAGAGAAGSLMGTFRRAWSGGGAAVDRSGARGRGCGGADAGSGGGRARRSMGACRQGGCAGATGACGRVRSGARFWSGPVWSVLSAGAGVVDAFGGALWRPGAAEHGAVPTGGMCGCGRGFWSGPVWRVLLAGAGVVDAFGWRVVAAVRCGTRVQRRARWLTFLPREKMLDKLCKSILN